MPLNLTTETAGIGKVLRSKLLAVPAHQRPYAWQEENVTALWDDLVRAELEEPDGYFLGQLVLGDATAPDNTHKVIDGQQRLATVSLIYAAAVRLFYDRGEGLRASFYRQHFLLDTNPSTLEPEPKLHLTVDDDPFFQALLVAVSSEQAGVIPEPTKESHSLIVHAFQFLSGKLAAYCDASGPSWVTKLLQLLAFVESSLDVISIQVGSDQNAYLIFETLNDRGVRLTTADLLKNMLYGQAGAQLATVQVAWTRMSQSLDVLNDDDAVTTFLRHFWISNRDHVREKELYKKIRLTITTPSAAVQLSSGLADSAETYASLLNSSDPRWTSSEVRTALDFMKLFRVTTIRPLLLAIAETTAGQLQRQLISALAGWSIRLAVAGGLGSGTTEETVGSAARSLRNSPVHSVGDLRGLLAGVVIDDEAFKKAFAIYRLTNTRQSRFLLSELEKTAMLEAGVPLEQVPNMNEAVVNLEHVMPKNPAVNGPWTALAQDDAYKTNVHRIGNHALMLLTDNGTVGNGSFQDKQPDYANSSLLLTKGLAGLTQFTFLELEARQDELARLAVLTWPK